MLNQNNDKNHYRSMVHLSHVAIIIIYRVYFQIFYMCMANVIIYNGQMSTVRQIHETYIERHICELLMDENTDY